jgi:hypothetical protein
MSLVGLCLIWSSRKLNTPSYTTIFDYIYFLTTSSIIHRYYSALDSSHGACYFSSLFLLTNVDVFIIFFPMPFCLTWWLIVKLKTTRNNMTFNSELLNTTTTTFVILPIHDWKMIRWQSKIMCNHQISRMMNLVRITGLRGNKFYKCLTFSTQYNGVYSWICFCHEMGALVELSMFMV